MIVRINDLFTVIRMSCKVNLLDAMRRQTGVACDARIGRRPVHFVPGLGHGEAAVAALDASFRTAR